MDSDEITYDDLDARLDEAETVTAPRPAGGTEVRLWVPVDPETLVELERRANSEKRGVSVVAADALRAGNKSHDFALRPPMTDRELEEVEKVLLHISDARTWTQRAAEALGKDGASPHVVDALRSSEQELAAAHRKLSQATYDRSVVVCSSSSTAIERRAARRASGAQVVSACCISQRSTPTGSTPRDKKYQRCTSSSATPARVAPIWSCGSGTSRAGARLAFVAPSAQGRRGGRPTERPSGCAWTSTPSVAGEVPAS